MIQKIDKKCIIVILLVAAIVIAYLVVRSTDFLTTTTEAVESTGVLPEILSGDEYIQTITCTENGLQTVSLCFATYARKNQSEVQVALQNQDGAVIQSWQINSSLLSDNSYYALRLDKRCDNSKGQTYRLVITSDAEAGNGITIHCNESEDSSGLSLDGESLDEMLCFQLTYRTESSDLFSEANGFHLIAILTLILALLCAIPIITKWQVENVFLVLWILMGALYLFALPLFRAADEPNHFYRAYEISEGYFLSEGIGSRELPLADVDLDLLADNWQIFSENKDMEISQELEDKAFPNTALYSPISYIPQALGIFIARHLTANVAVIAYAGRIGNWIFITLILYVALRLIPVGKGMMAAIALMPMNIQESICLAPDGMVVAVSMLLIAAVLYLRQPCEKKMKVWQLTGLYVLALVISALKIVYLPFCLLYLLIPKERFGAGRSKWLHLAAMAALSAGFSLVWLKLCSGFLVIDGTNAAVQLSWILRHPILYLEVLARTVFTSAGTWMTTMAGISLGALNIATVEFFILAYLCLLACKCIRRPQTCRKNKRKGCVERGFFGVVVFGIVLLIATSLYLQWNSPYRDVIEGIQGRYFIALILPLYFAVNSPADLCLEHFEGELSVWEGGLITCINSCAGLAVLFACIEKC